MNDAYLLSHQWNQHYSVHISSHRKNLANKIGQSWDTPSRFQFHFSLHTKLLICNSVICKLNNKRLIEQRQKIMDLKKLDIFQPHGEMHCPAWLKIYGYQTAIKTGIDNRTAKERILTDTTQTHKRTLVHNQRATPSRRNIGDITHLGWD